MLDSKGVREYLYRYFHGSMLLINWPLIIWYDHKSRIHASHRTVGRSSHSFNQCRLLAIPIILYSSLTYYLLDCGNGQIFLEHVMFRFYKHSDIFYLVGQTFQRRYFGTDLSSPWFCCVLLRMNEIIDGSTLLSFHDRLRSFFHVMPKSVSVLERYLLYFEWACLLLLLPLKIIEIVITRCLYIGTSY